MSKLKDQLKVILPTLSSEANHNRDKQVKYRLYALKAVVESKKDVKKACEAKGISTDFFYKWGGRLSRARKLSSLMSKSRKPKKSPTQTPKRVEKKIRKLRIAEPSYGPERISFYMGKLHSITIQTDNGVEFTDKYRVNRDGKPTGGHPLDMWYLDREIEHKLIPVGVKELNGKVENTHGFDDREFYSRYPQSFTSYESLAKSVYGWNLKWNSSRHTAKLGWRTPDEVLQAAYLRYIVFLLNWVEQLQPLVKLNEDGVFELKTPAPQTRKRRKPKRLTLAARYLAWMDGEEKESRKSVIAVPTMWWNSILKCCQVQWLFFLAIANLSIVQKA